jgi:putative ABC transport system permease protein
MTVAGILNPTGTADDKGIFVDIKTSWIIAGLAHGHQDLIEGPDSLLLTKSDSLLVASPSVLSYTEITEENLDSFHFHGDISEYPLDAILVIPESRRQSIQLRGRFEQRTDNIQMIVPLAIVNDLVDTMFSVRDTVVAAGMTVVGAALAIMTLVYWLSFKIRQQEINTIRKIGGANASIYSMLGIEIGLTVGIGILLALLATMILSRFGLPLVEGFLTS